MPKAAHAWRLRGPARFFCEAFLKQSTPQKMFYETVALKQKVRKGIRQINNLPQSGTSCGPGRQPPSSAPLVAERCRTNRQRPEPPSVKSPRPWALTTRNSCTAGYARKLLPIAPQTYWKEQPAGCPQRLVRQKPVTKKGLQLSLQAFGFPGAEGQN